MTGISGWAGQLDLVPWHRGFARELPELYRMTLTRRPRSMVSFCNGLTIKRNLD